MFSDSLKDRIYYEPTNQGEEMVTGERLDAIRRWKKGETEGGKAQEREQKAGAEEADRSFHASRKNLL